MPAVTIEKQCCRVGPDGAVQCWAHSKAGVRCLRPVLPREGEPVPIPYCAMHMESGDGALKVTAARLGFTTSICLPAATARGRPVCASAAVTPLTMPRPAASQAVSHPNKDLGKILVARHPLPAGYQMCFWGDRTQCPWIFEDDRTLQYKSGKLRRHPNGVIDPTSHRGSLLQFMSCPGPEELQTVSSCSGPGAYFGTHGGRLVGQRCKASADVPKDTQLAFQYGAEWFKIRGLPRLPAGTPRWPLPTRAVPASHSAVRAGTSRRVTRWAAEQVRWQQLHPLLGPLLKPGGRSRPTTAAALAELGCSAGRTGGIVAAAASDKAQRWHSRCRFYGVDTPTTVRALQASDHGKAVVKASSGRLSWLPTSSLHNLAQLPDASVDVCLGRQALDTLLRRSAPPLVDPAIAKTDKAAAVKAAAKLQLKRGKCHSKDKPAVEKKATQPNRRPTTKLAQAKQRRIGRQRALACAAELSRVTRPGGAVVVESFTTPTEDPNLAWLAAVLPALDWAESYWTVEIHLAAVDGAPTGKAQMSTVASRQPRVLPCLYVLRKHSRTGDDADEEAAGPCEVDIDVIDHGCDEGTGSSDEEADEEDDGSQEDEDEDEEGDEDEDEDEGEDEQQVNDQDDDVHDQMTFKRRRPSTSGAMKRARAY